MSCAIPQDEGTDLPYFPSTKENRPSLYIVPSGIRPAVQRTAIEVSVPYFFILFEFLFELSNSCTVVQCCFFVVCNFDNFCQFCNVCMYQSIRSCTKSVKEKETNKIPKQECTVLRGELISLSKKLGKNSGNITKRRYLTFCHNHRTVNGEVINMTQRRTKNKKEHFFRCPTLVSC